MVIVRALVLVFLSTLALDWPALPFNARLADVLFVALAIAVAVRPFRRPTLHPLDMLVACYFAGSVIATLVSGDPRSSAIELIRHGYLIVIYVVIAAAVRQGFAATIGLGLALSGALLANIGLALMFVTLVTGIAFPGAGDLMTLPYVGNVLRLRAFTATEAMLASVLAMAVPFAMVRATGERAARWGITTALMIGAASLTFSHSVAGVLVASLLSARPWLQARTIAWRLSIAATIIGVLVFNFAATISIRSIGTELRDRGEYSYGVETRRTTISGVEVEFSVISYFRLKEIAWDAFKTHPLAGAGLDQFHTLTYAAYSAGRLPSHYQETDPHSTFLGRLAETGLTGTLPLIALWIGIFMTARELLAQPIERPVALALFAGLCGLLVNTFNADVMNFRFLWVAIGLLRGLSEPGVLQGGRAERINAFETPGPGAEVTAVAREPQVIRERVRRR